MNFCSVSHKYGMPGKAQLQAQATKAFSSH